MVQEARGVAPTLLATLGVRANRCHDRMLEFLQPHLCQIRDGRLAAPADISECTDGDVADTCLPER
jgi:hypothetical protein